MRIYVPSAPRYGRDPPHLRWGAHQTPHHQAFRSGRHSDRLLRLNTPLTLNTPNTRTLWTQERKRCKSQLGYNVLFRAYFSSFRLNCSLSWPLTSLVSKTTLFSTLNLTSSYRQTLKTHFCLLFVSFQLHDNAIRLERRNGNHETSS